MAVVCVFWRSHGLVGVRTAMNMEQFPRPLVVVYYKLDFSGKGKKETSYWRNRFACDLFLLMQSSCPCAFTVC